MFKDCRHGKRLLLGFTTVGHCKRLLPGLHKPQCVMKVSRCGDCRVKRLLSCVTTVAGGNRLFPCVMSVNSGDDLQGVTPVAGGDSYISRSMGRTSPVLCSLTHRSRSFAGSTARSSWSTFSIVCRQERNTMTSPSTSLYYFDHRIIRGGIHCIRHACSQLWGHRCPNLGSLLILNIEPK